MSKDTSRFATYKLGAVKQIDIFKNRQIDKFKSNLLKIDKKRYKNINIYNNGYITIKKIDDCENIYSVNPL